MPHQLLFYLSSFHHQIFNGRKTDQCGVVIFGSEGQPQPIIIIFSKTFRIDTKNAINAARGGYESVVEYIPIAQPNSSTIAKIDALQASITSGDRTVSRAISFVKT